MEGGRDPKQLIMCLCLVGKKVLAEYNGLLANEAMQKFVRVIGK